jgi:adenosylcobinamide kinase/adenosylcobinamide-phosphate guanylyltransferase
MDRLPNLTLVTGGAASGKSAFAERLCAAGAGQKVYLATAVAHDDEMHSKIARHRARRDASWLNIEAPVDLATPLAERSRGEVVLVDCLTLWLSNLMAEDRDVDAAIGELVQKLDLCAAHLILVTNEVGQGIVPENALARRFRNAQGRLNQTLAQHADLVVAVMSGLPLVLKGDLPGGVA